MKEFTIKVHFRMKIFNCTTIPFVVFYEPYILNVTQEIILQKKKQNLENQNTNNLEKIASSELVMHKLNICIHSPAWVGHVQSSQGQGQSRDPVVPEGDLDRRLNNYRYSVRQLLAYQIFLLEVCKNIKYFIYNLT